MTRTGPERHLAAIMVADIVGYSRLIGIDEAGTLRRLKALRREVIDPSVAAAHGRIVKTMGDGLLVEFLSPVHAVSCAVRIQHTLVTRDPDLPTDRQFRLRIGINLGDVDDFLLLSGRSSVPKMSKLLGQASDLTSDQARQASRQTSPACAGIIRTSTRLSRRSSPGRACADARLQALPHRRPFRRFAARAERPPRRGACLSGCFGARRLRL